MTEPVPTAENDVPLHKDPWMMRRINTALDAIRYSEREDLETALDLLAFAEDVLAHYVIPPDKDSA